MSTKFTEAQQEVIKALSDAWASLTSLKNVCEDTVIDKMRTSLLEMRTTVRLLEEEK